MQIFAERKGRAGPEAVRFPSRADLRWQAGGLRRRLGAGAPSGPVQAGCKMLRRIRGNNFIGPYPGIIKEDTLC